MKYKVAYLCIVAALWAIGLSTMGCQSVPISAPAQEASTALQAALSWELPTNDGQVSQGAHPERRAWSVALFNELDKNYDVLMTASDIRTLIPKFDSLNRAQRVTVLAELMSTVAEYESSWNPNCVSKDVNGSSAPGLQARGFFQMNSDADQVNYRTGTKYTYQQLMDPFINIEVGVKILVTVVKVRGKITFKNNEKSQVLRFFFATLVTDTAYGSKTLAAAKKRIAALDFVK